MPPTAETVKTPATPPTLKLGVFRLCTQTLAVGGIRENPQNQLRRWVPESNILTTLRREEGDLIMKVLLVYPEFPDTYWSFKHALSFEGKKSAFPPLGLLTVSAMLPESWERRLVDMNVRKLKQADVEWADVVFASAMIVQQESLKSVVKLSNAHGKRVVVGGPFVTTTLNPLEGADHVVLGEAEETLPGIIRDLERGEAQAVYQAPERPAMSLTPIPDFKLADMRRYSAMSVQYSRGCPFN